MLNYEDKKILIKEIFNKKKILKQCVLYFIFSIILSLFFYLASINLLIQGDKKEAEMFYNDSHECPTKDCKIFRKYGFKDEEYIRIRKEYINNHDANYYIFDIEKLFEKSRLNSERVYDFILFTNKKIDEYEIKEKIDKEEIKKQLEINKDIYISDAELFKDILNQRNEINENNKIILKSLINPFIILFNVVCVFMIFKFILITYLYIMYLIIKRKKSIIEVKERLLKEIKSIDNSAIFIMSGFNMTMFF